MLAVKIMQEGGGGGGGNPIFQCPTFAVWRWLVMVSVHYSKEKKMHFAVFRFIKILWQICHFCAFIQTSFCFWRAIFGFATPHSQLSSCYRYSRLKGERVKETIDTKTSAKKDVKMSYERSHSALNKQTLTCGFVWVAKAGIVNNLNK